MEFFFFLSFKCLSQTLMTTYKQKPKTIKGNKTIVVHNKQINKNAIKYEKKSIKIIFHSFTLRCSNTLCLTSRNSLKFDLTKYHYFSIIKFI